MKYAIVLWLAAVISVYGQERLYLVTRTGGKLNGGTIVSFDPQGSNINVDLNFGAHMQRPRHANQLGPDGFLYGMAFGGNATGGIFKIRPDGSGYQQLFDFGSEPGLSNGAMAISDDGRIYGATSNGGAYGGGIIYSIRQDGTGYVELHSFNWGTSNSNVNATMLVGSDGLIYGTHHLGSDSHGSIYAVAIDGSGFREVLKFGTVQLETPADLLQGDDEKLYGTGYGSSTSSAQLFRINTDGTEFESIHSFSVADSRGYGIHQGSNGRIYGYLTGNMGGIFSCKPDGSDYFVLHTFSLEEGTKPANSIVEAPDGFLYGSTTLGGANNLGTVFRISPDGSSFEVLSHSTESPVASRLHVDDTGAVYAFTSEGGQYGNGTLYKINISSAEIVHSFGAPDTTSYLPPEGVTQIDNKFLGFAVPRALTPQWVPTIVGVSADQTLITHSLPSPTNSNGISRPVMGPEGYLYATDLFSGTNSAGLLFKSKDDGSSYSAIHNFSGLTGTMPQGEILFGLDGRIYGTCFQGGVSNSGLIYAVNADGTNFSVLHQFSYPTGQLPVAGLTQGSDGTIYGTAKNVFKIYPNGTGYQQLHSFQVHEAPGGELVLVGDYLYGILVSGGSAGKGAVYRIKNDGSDYSVVHNFSGTDGEKPYSGLLLYAGALYGSTSLGGQYGLGTVFKLNSTGEEFLKIIDLSHETGGKPTGDLAGKCVPAFKPAITIANNLLTSSASFGNQWYKDGQLIPAANKITYEALASGVYTVAVDLLGCPGNMSDGQLVNITSVADEGPDRLVKIYPNPTSQNFVIDVPGRNLEVGSITIFDTMGNIVLSDEGKINAGSEYDMSRHATGVYIIRVQVGSASTYIKIIKN